VFIIGKKRSGEEKVPAPHWEQSVAQCAPMRAIRLALVSLARPFRKRLGGHFV
jgi:hypothetical protein